MVIKFSRRKAPRRKPGYSSRSYPKRKRTYVKRYKKTYRKKARKYAKTTTRRPGRYARKPRRGIRGLRKKGVLDTSKKNITRIKFVTGVNHKSHSNVLAEIKPLLFSTTHKTSTTPLSSFVEFWATNPVNCIPFTTDRFVRMHRHSDTVTLTGLYINLFMRLSAGSAWRIRVMIFEHRELPDESFVTSRMLFSDPTLNQFPVGFEDTVQTCETGYGEEVRSNLPWKTWQDSRNITQTRREDLMKGRPVFDESKITMIHDHIYNKRNGSKVVKNAHINISRHAHRVYKYPSKYNTTFTRGAAVPSIFPNPSDEVMNEVANSGVYRNKLYPFKKLYVMILAHATVPGPYPYLYPSAEEISDSHKPEEHLPTTYGQFPAHRHSTHPDYKDRLKRFKPKEAKPPPVDPGDSASQAGGRAKDKEEEDHGDDPPDDDEPDVVIDPSFVGPQYAWLEVAPQIDFCFRNNADSVPILS
ncbi:hypothetical protein DFJ58DRAFT_880178 [Suillus subalutaceus]|uniref:uncharacterized protein n=1 Tax=Suillus subalutaceus TaxID=48586 RepID=UPI001B8609FD|nr:uncharacterized protein DFJ58DRAFT_880167 [Suillus subalutaceus]XP_041234941.1 uncharacterized protein DFJ58DRAFT_880178 [Suillus subalutaceus]KAG1827744.1 hypothetical protein DFJ58DRAFT_880167 [Suillus subalutaceus]KAG1827747.1 hypothetical protein DFJ58DRAFT_880178 [Suillus subalutaceus]